MIRVCHFVEATGGGVLSVISDILNASASRSDIVHTVFYSRRKETPADLSAALPGAELIEISLGRSLLAWSDILNFFYIIRFLRGFDVVHCHSSKAGFLGRLASFFISSRVRFYYSPHCYAFLSEEFSRYKRFLVNVVERVLAKLSSSTTVACGDSEYLLALGLGGHSILSRNGIFVREKFLSSPSKTDGIVRVVGSGRNCLQKDPLFFEDISRACADLNVCFKWVGEHPNPNIGTGWVTREESQEMLRDCDIFIATSKWEGLPIAGLEAMREGKPLLVRNSPGLKDLVVHGLNGFVYETIDEAVAYLDIMSSSSALLRKMGAASRYIVNTYYSSLNYEMVLDLYCGKPVRSEVVPGYSHIVKDFMSAVDCKNEAASHAPIE